MGATETYRPKGLSHLEFFTQEGYVINNETTLGRFLAMASVGNIVYGAFERVDLATGKRVVLAEVFRTQWGKGHSRNHNFWYRDSLCEAEGPYFWDCPEKILKLLTPLEDSGLEGEQLQYATRWRAQCRRNHELRECIKAGAVVETEPINFAVGHAITQFQVERLSPWTVRALNDRGEFLFYAKLTKARLMLLAARYLDKQEKEVAA